MPLIPLLGAEIESAAVARSVNGESSVTEPAVFVAVAFTARYLPT